jgi:hypothetical protein
VTQRFICVTQRFIKRIEKDITIKVFKNPSGLMSKMNVSSRALASHSPLLIPISMH